MKDRTSFDYSCLLRQLSTVEPSPETIERVIERTRGALIENVLPETVTSQVPSRLDNVPTMRMTAAISAAVVVVFGLACFVFFTTSGASNAFAHVQVALEEIASVAYSVEMVKVPKDLSASSGSALIDLESPRSRFESSDGSEILVVDIRRGILMQLNTVEKRALIQRSQPLSQTPSFRDFLDRLRTCDADTVEQLKNASLDGRMVERYRLLPESPIAGGVGMLVFVDPKMHLPVRMEISTDVFGDPFHAVYKDFSFEPCDPELFSTIPPDGYVVDQVNVPVSQDPDSKTRAVEAVVELPTKVSIEVFAVAAAKGPTTTQVIAPNDGGILSLQTPPIVSSSDIVALAITERKTVMAGGGSSSRTQSALQIELTPGGAEKMEEATQSSHGKRIAVVVDGKVVATPTVFSTIRDKFEISGDAKVLSEIAELLKP